MLILGNYYDNVETQDNNLTEALHWYNQAKIKGYEPDQTEAAIQRVRKNIESIEPMETIGYDQNFKEADVDSKVSVITYVQGKQGWWEKDGQGAAIFYTQNKNAGYFIYTMPVTYEEYEKLTIGTPIAVTEYKAEWACKIEIIDAEFKIMEGNYMEELLDVTSLLDTDELGFRSISDS